MFPGLEDSCHVHEKNGEIYSAVLGMVDLARGTNSYYKVQVLVHDHAKQLSMITFVKFVFMRLLFGMATEMTKNGGRL